ncbi:MAG: D-glycero-beta-D-manno-heptose 1-phosphate adenylyltransferase [Saprospiraceae bacterium]|nr:D-glycero-beta-D-manno-heptose 1-phosphate adenylyltransferase [Saprospiraceae bacterium]
MYDKVLSYHSEQSTEDALKSIVGKIVFTNGCFDLLHPGHVDYLDKARKLGDILIVGLNDDASVKRLKGEKRPLLPLADRAILLAALESVDYVIPFSEDTPLQLIKAVKPHTLVKGGDYTLDEMIGKDYVESRGGQVRIIPFLEGYSTTSLLERLQNL